MEKILLLSQLTVNQRARILNINGGFGFQRRLRVMGVREGQIIKVVSKQPFRGPYTISIGGSNITIGRGMANKIAVEVLR
jgi:ferrous iron transport protein A